MKTRKIPIPYLKLKNYCSEYKKTESYKESSYKIDCRKDAFTLFNQLVEAGFLTRTGEKAEDLKEKLMIYTVIHSFAGDQTIFNVNDFESFAQGIAGQANVVGVYFDITTAVSNTAKIVMEALGRNQIKGNFDIKNVDRVTRQLERSNNYVFGKISNAGTIEYFTIHRNIVNRSFKQSTDLRELYNTYGNSFNPKDYDNLTYKSWNLDKILDEEIYDLSINFRNPEKVERSAVVFYAPVSDTFYLSLTGQKIGNNSRKTYIYIVKFDDQTRIIATKEQSASTTEEDLEMLRNEVEIDVFEI